GPAQHLDAMQDDADGYADTGQQQAGRQRLAGGGEEPAEDVLLEDDADEGGGDLRRQRHPEPVGGAQPDDDLLPGEGGRKRAEPQRGGQQIGSFPGASLHVRSLVRALASSSCMPRVASSRRSFQISATWRPNASLVTTSEVRGRGSAISTTRFTRP